MRRRVAELRTLVLPGSRAAALRDSGVPHPPVLLAVDALYLLLPRAALLGGAGRCGYGGAVREVDRTVVGADGDDDFLRGG